LIIFRLRIEDMDGGLSRPEKLSMLRGQLSMLRRQREEELPITVESLARAERVARNLELTEVAS
jgi:hypothetical protein